MFYLLKSAFPLVKRFHFSIIPEKFKDRYLNKFQLFFSAYFYLKNNPA
jgi:hypothetical protein